MSESKMEMLMRMESNRILHNAQVKAERLTKAMNYNASVLAKERARNAEYNKRFEVT